MVEPREPFPCEPLCDQSRAEAAPTVPRAHMAARLPPTAALVAWAFPSNSCETTKVNGNQIELPDHLEERETLASDADTLPDVLTALTQR
jgi:hypothetical protein